MTVNGQFQRVAIYDSEEGFIAGQINESFTWLVELEISSPNPRKENHITGLDAMPLDQSKGVGCCVDSCDLSARLCIDGIGWGGQGKARQRLLTGQRKVHAIRS